MTYNKYTKLIEKAKEKNVSKKYKMLLKQEKNKYKRKFHLSKPQTTKVIVTYLFLLLNAIIVFACVSMWHFGDLSYLGVLISDIAAQVVVFGIYAVKAYFGKKQEESVKLERDRIGIDYISNELNSNPNTIYEDVSSNS